MTALPFLILMISAFLFLDVAIHRQDERLGVSALFVMFVLVGVSGMMIVLNLLSVLF
jgi:hypothetical protein